MAFAYGSWAGPYDTYDATYIRRDVDDHQRQCQRILAEVRTSYGKGHSYVVCRSVRSRILPIQEIQLEIFSHDVCARRKSAGSRATQHAMDVELERLSPNNHFSLESEKKLSTMKLVTAALLVAPVAAFNMDMTFSLGKKKAPAPKKAAPKKVAVAKKAVAKKAVAKVRWLGTLDVDACLCLRKHHDSMTCGCLCAFFLSCPHM